MADKAISELVRASIITGTDLFVLQQDNTAKCLPGQVLLNWLTAAADGHGGIADWKKIDTSGLVDTYRVTLADTKTFDYYVTNGKAISSVKQTAVSGLTRTYTISFNDETTQPFTVTDGRGILSVEQTSVSGLTRTYTISFNDGTTKDFEITDGRSFVRMEKTETNDLVDTYTIFCNDGSTETLTVTNGEKGDKGDRADIWVRYASQKPTESSHNFGELPDSWIGIATGHNMDAAPTDWKQYIWYQWKGEKGDPGDPATLVSSEIRYQASDSGIIIPSGSWSASVPVVAQGRYLWTRTTNTFNTGSPVVSYSVSRMGLDGSGSVSSVANISPDADGNVPLTAENVGALPKTGGNLTGELRMNGQPISGLNAPTEDDQAANMGYVNQQVRKAAPRSLVDNGNFEIAQAGYGGMHGARMFVADRWESESNAISVRRENGVIIIDNSGNDAEAVVIQKCTDELATAMSGNVHTLVVYDEDWNPHIHSAIPLLKEEEHTSCVVQLANTAVIQTTFFGINSSKQIVRISVHARKILKLRAIRMYPGEYTLETIPEYQPNGYGAELAECRRYYRKYNTRKQGVFFYHNAIMVFGLDKTPMRETPSTVNVESITDIGGNVDFKDTIVRYEKNENGLVFMTLNMSRDVNSWVYVTGIEESAEIL